jgi:hypothetical protein
MEGAVQPSTYSNHHPRYKNPDFSPSIGLIDPISTRPLFIFSSINMRSYTILALATLAAASHSPSPPCTKTIKPTSFTCCDTIAGATTTSYTNCGGCALEYEATPQCRCFQPPPTDPALTSTETACGASQTPSLSKKPHPPKATVAPYPTTLGSTTGPAATCTTRITSLDGSCGDCAHTYATTKTAEVDCHGCALVVTTEAGVGICACPTETETTVTACATKRAAGYV